MAFEETFPHKKRKVEEGQIVDDCTQTPNG